MRLRSHLVEIASVIVLAAFASSNALAQGNTTSPSTNKSTQSAAAQSKAPAAPSAPAASPSTSQSKAATAPSAGPWTADNVTAARPFGNINISAAGTTQQSISTWAQQRTPAERAEISGRCMVITNAGNASRYPADAQSFCRNYMMVASADTGAGKATSKTTR